MGGPRRLAALAGSALDYQHQFEGPAFCISIRSILLETFVERPRHVGTCYKAANWICVGQTQGRGKLDRYKLRDKPIKDIWLYPLDRRFRSVLTASRLPVGAPTAAGETP